MTWRPDPASIGVNLDLGNLAGDGSNLTVRFEPGVGMIVIRTIPERVMQAARDANRVSREFWKKGRLLQGGSQAHWAPVYSMPAAIRQQWTAELGDARSDPSDAKKWKRRLNSSEFRDFRTSDYHL